MNCSKTKIFNIALNNLGISNVIQDCNDNNPKAVMLNNYYDIARDTVLTNYEWSFATVYKNLSQPISKSPNPNFEHAFVYPNDCIFPRAIINPSDKKEKKYELAVVNDTQRVILTDYNPCVLRYTRRVTNETLFSADFIDCLSLYLAAITAQTLTGSKEKANICYRLYNGALRRSIRNDSAKTTRNDQDDEIFTDSRY